MKTNDLAARCNGWENSTENSPELLQIVQSGEYIEFSTGRRYLRRTRAAGFLCAVAGAAWTWFTFWAWPVVILGIVVARYAPNAVRPVCLLRMSTEDGLLAECAASGTAVAGRPLIAIRGRYETQGWDPRSVIYALIEEGYEIPILIFGGTDEPLAEYACRALGFLLVVPATYSGTEGVHKSCFEPGYADA
jgi:hypothetical protein